jgi:hypothetical protein
MKNEERFLFRLPGGKSSPLWRGGPKGRGGPFFILHSSFFIVMSFFILHSSFFIAHAHGAVTFSTMDNSQKYSSNPNYSMNGSYGQQTVPTAVYAKGPALGAAECQAAVNSAIWTQCSYRNDCKNLSANDVRAGVVRELGNMGGANYSTACFGYIDSAFNAYKRQTANAIAPAGFPSATNPAGYQSNQPPKQNIVTVENMTPKYESERDARERQLAALQAMNNGAPRVTMEDMPGTFSDLPFTQRMAAEKEGWKHPAVGASTYANANLKIEPRNWNVQTGYYLGNYPNGVAIYQPKNWNVQPGLYGGAGVDPLILSNRVNPNVQTERYKGDGSVDPLILSNRMDPNVQTERYKGDGSVDPLILSDRMDPKVQQQIYKGDGSVDPLILSNRMNPNVQMERYKGDGSVDPLILSDRVDPRIQQQIYKGEGGPDPLILSDRMDPNIQKELYKGNGENPMVDSKGDFYVQPNLWYRDDTPPMAPSDATYDVQPGLWWRRENVPMVGSDGEFYIQPGLYKGPGEPEMVQNPEGKFMIQQKYWNYDPCWQHEDYDACVAAQEAEFRQRQGIHDYYNNLRYTNERQGNAQQQQQQQIGPTPTGNPYDKDTSPNGHAWFEQNRARFEAEAAAAAAQQAAQQAAPAATPAAPQTPAPAATPPAQTPQTPVAPAAPQTPAPAATPPAVQTSPLPVPPPPAAQTAPPEVQTPPPQVPPPPSLPPAPATLQTPDDILNYYNSMLDW